MRSSLAIAVAMLAAAAPLAAQTISTPANPNGWAFFDGKNCTTACDPAVITGTNPYDGTGSVQMTLTNGNQQPVAEYTFSTGVALSTFLSGSFAFTGDPNLLGIGGGTPTYRLLLDNITNAGPVNAMTYGSMGWYQPVGASTTTAFTVANFALGSGDFFFQVAGSGHGRAGLSCSNTSYAGSFDDRRQTLSAWETNCNGGNNIDLSTALVVGFEADYGSYPNFTGTSNVYVDKLAAQFTGGPNVSTNFELDGPNGAVPEPATLSLMATGLVGLAGAARRRKRSL